MSEHDFWTADLPLAEGRFHQEQTAIRVKLHESWEPYSRTAGPEIIPIHRPRGQRLYILARPYVLEPDARLAVQLYPYPTPGDRGAVGEVVQAAWHGLRQRDVGSAQAWYYPDEAILVLWEVLLAHRDRPPVPEHDTNLCALRDGFERVLRARLPAVAAIATPADEPEYEPEQWQAFLRARGYEPLTHGAWSKRCR